MNNKFSENLKRIRKENNLSQEQLADELGVSRQAISKWESAVAYPEMDKIIALCDKFNLNIDDLLHRDINEVKGEEESKKKINNYIDDFLSFVTNTINLFSSMKFKSKIKCIFEQILIAVVLLLASILFYNLLEQLFRNVFQFLPDKVYFFVINIIESILIAGLTIISIIILTHIFKTRYLDYYEKIKNENEDDKVDNNEDSDSNEKENKEDDKKDKKISFKKDDNKIIIRDPKHSEYRFIKGLLKVFVYVIKFFVCLIALGVIAGLIGLVVSVVVSFLIAKTGLFFAGVLITILSSISITIIILLLLLNFVFNRKNDKKKMIRSFIVSLISFGIGAGLVFCGTLSFKVYDDDYEMLESVTSTYKMNNDFMIFNEYYDNVKYIETNDNDVKVEYRINRVCKITELETESKGITFYSDCDDDPIKLVKEFLNNINHKKIIPISGGIYEVNIYANKKNIAIMKNNANKEHDRIKKYEEQVNFWESRINELENDLEKTMNENNELREKISELENNNYNE